jgi:hypothetical protein
MYEKEYTKQKMCVFSAIHILIETVDNVKASGDDFQFINHQQLETVTFNRSVTVI